MARIEPIEIDQATGNAKELLDEPAGRGGEPGPMVRAMANAPALVRGYLNLNRAGQQVIAGPGDVSDAQIDELHRHGYTDEHIAEVVGLVALQLLTGGLKLVAGIEPAPEDLAELTSQRTA